MKDNTVFGHFLFQQLQQPLRLRYVPCVHGPQQPVPILPLFIFVRLQEVLEAIVLEAQPLCQAVAGQLVRLPLVRLYEAEHGRGAQAQA